MRKHSSKNRLVFVEAEKTAGDFPLLAGKLPEFMRQEELKGVLDRKDIQKRIEALGRLSVDDYIRETVSPSEHPKRKSAPEIIKQLGGALKEEINEGPLYLAELEFDWGGHTRRMVFLAQNRKNKNGVWMPRHHRLASDLINQYSDYGFPVVCFIDTPGADASEEANRENQAHRISDLITDMTNLPLPSVGIVFGGGYSGGAIPLASTNMLLSVRDGVFNTIHPVGLSEIAYNYNLSWQECAKYIGVSAYEQCQYGYLDGVVDYSPLDAGPPNALREAILSAVTQVEANAKIFLNDHNNHYFFEHYRKNILNYLNPSELISSDHQEQFKSPTGRLNIFGSVYRFHRFLMLRRRLSSQSVRRYSRVFSKEAPTGELTTRLTRERIDRFRKWAAGSLGVRYDDNLNKRYKRFLDTRKDLGQDRNRFTSFFIGHPEENYKKAVDDLAAELGLHLYNHWKIEARENLVHLLGFLKDLETDGEVAPAKATLIDLLKIPDVKVEFVKVARNLVLFDLLFDRLVENLPSIAAELRGSNRITQETMEELLNKVFQEASSSFDAFIPEGKVDKGSQEFFIWLEAFISRGDVEQLMKQVSTWKRLAFPRLSEPLFGILSYFFSNLLPSFYEASRGEKTFEGKINPRNIGIKDFWERLNQAYRDLLIQNLLAEYKKKPILPQDIIGKLFSNFEETSLDLMTSDPVKFPGFRQSIERALKQGVSPVGVITGFADFQFGELNNRLGLVISNTAFQAGAFDMAAGEKVSKLMVECAVNNLPLVLFISSGGMQTKEGAGALFSMAVLNDRINRFVKDFHLPVICFGYRDCTGGAQASFVTHRLVRTYYLSGGVIPFAGQRVVPSHLPAESVMANYLSETEGAMDGLVLNPFDVGIEDKLQDIDASIPLPTESIAEALARVLRGEYHPTPVVDRLQALPSGFITHTPVRRMLVHARGATAVRLIEGAHAAGVDVVLVQSDADMESYPTRLLNPQDRLVCLGGNTPQESYLNGMSVIRIAEQETVDAIHPGIGFLSENPNFAILCRRHGMNFIGPRAVSMELMGNKSNAIATAKRLKVSVVPGSEGVVTDPDKAEVMAEEIGYPVLIKAAFGGGGKGMRVVQSSPDFKDGFIRTGREALSAFGNGDVYLEKFVESMRHVEIQVLRDRFGNTRILGIRDCSVQRNNQKLIEESGSYRFPKELQDAIYTHAENICADIDYIGAGTIEFIYDRREKQIYFMEMNTRLQVEHPVTEATTEVDIVKEQIRIASGESIEALNVKPRGYSMELRINAERMVVDGEGQVAFVPAPGKVVRLRYPVLRNVRVIAAVDEGSEVTPYYDSLIMQIVAHGRSRPAVIKDLREFLKGLDIDGVYTNIALMEAILVDPVFNKGDYDTGYLQTFYESMDSEALLEAMESRNASALAKIDLEAVRIEESDELKVLSPRTGVFYGSPAPDEEPFVHIGDVLDVNSTLCLMEAMKVFEDLTLDSYNRADGVELFPQSHHFTVTQILAETGQTVNQGDLLFVVKPVVGVVPDKVAVPG